MRFSGAERSCCGIPAWVGELGVKPCRGRGKHVGGRISGVAEHHARALRSSRAEPPGRASQDLERRHIYTAALQQFEELVTAARGVGPASRPLLLFYALSQAGRAVVAAYGDAPQITAHGLAEDRNVQPDDVLHRRIVRVPRKDCTDAFGAVARATASEDLRHGAELGALWAALPGTYRVPPGSWQPEWRSALTVDTGLLSRGGDADKLALLVSNLGGNPHVRGFDVFANGRYPTLPADTKAAMRGGREIEAGSWVADIEIPATSNRDDLLDEIAPQLYAGQDRALIPTLPGESGVLTPLMLWWALLFGLSIVARYHPGPWTRALAVEGSKHAVPLEALLVKALELLPVLVYEAIFLNSAYDPPEGHGNVRQNVNTVAERSSWPSTQRPET